MIVHVFRPKLNTGYVEVNWTHPIGGQYDPSHYMVQLFEKNTETNNTETKSFVVPADSNNVTVSVSFNSTVHARISVTSKCNETSNGKSTSTIRIPQTSSKS